MTATFQEVAERAASFDKLIEHAGALDPWLLAELGFEVCAREADDVCWYARTIGKDAEMLVMADELAREFTRKAKFCRQMHFQMRQWWTKQMGDIEYQRIAGEAFLVRQSKNPPIPIDIPID